MTITVFCSLLLLPSVNALPPAPLWWASHCRSHHAAARRPRPAPRWANKEAEVFTSASQRHDGAEGCYVARSPVMPQLK